MARWLSEEWFDQALEIWSETSGPSGLSGRVQCEITGGPDGDVSCYWVFEDGRVVSGWTGRMDRPEVTVTVPWDDAVAIQRGDLDASVAYMRGRMKVSGSMTVMTDVLAWAHRPECGKVQKRVADLSGW